jgi:tetratricopeptide (TPR) repeat protein
MGRFYEDLGWWKDAVEAFEAAEEQGLSHFANQWGIGRARKEIGDIRGAVEALRKALANPRLPSSAQEQIEALYEECLTELAEGASEKGDSEAEDATAGTAGYR